MQNKLLGCVLFIIIFLFSSTPSLAITLLTDKEALRIAFLDHDEVVEETKVVFENEIDIIKQRLGGQLVHYTRGKKAEEIIHQRIFSFYFGKKNGAKTTVAIILEEPGKWGPIKFMVILNMEGRVKSVFVLSYTETRGRPIARQSFLNQFAGKTSKDRFLLNKDVVAISGATISSAAAAFTVKKAIILYEELYLKKQTQ